MSNILNVDANRVAQVIGNSKRFTSSFNEPSSYYICADRSMSGEEIFAGELENYWSRLVYAVEHADDLISEAFRTEFYDFYGVDKSKVDSAEDMCRRLHFDSFVLCVKEKEISVYLTNDDFMFGHFIDVCWDDKWKLLHSDIC